MHICMLQLSSLDLRRRREGRGRRKREGEFSNGSVYLLNATPVTKMPRKIGCKMAHNEPLVILGGTTMYWQ